MDSIVGLGAAGCAITDKFAQYPQYKIFKIDQGLKGYQKDGVYGLKKYDSHQGYEENTPKMTHFFKNITKDVLFITSGAGKVSGCTLQVLKQLHDKKCNINVLYVRPDLTLLSGAAKLQERLTCGVLQEYARSGVFEALYVIGNPEAENFIGELSINNYYDKINNLISSSFHMLNVFNNTKPVLDTSSGFGKLARIRTLSVLNLETNEEKMLYDLNRPEEKIFYFAISQESLENDGKLLNKIKEQIKDNTQENCSSSYRVHSTQYEDDFAYCVVGTSEIQKV
jgi:hypothetical protein